jgi:hypothetical protein
MMVGVGGRGVVVKACVGVASKVGVAVGTKLETEMFRTKYSS